MFACVISTDEFKCFQNVLQANTYSMFVTRPSGSVNVSSANSLTPRCEAIKRRDEGEEVHRYGYSASRATMPHGATTRRPGGLSTERWAKPNPTSWHHKKSGAEHSIQRHSSSPTGLSGGCAKPIFDHAHEKSAKRQGDRGLMLRPSSSNLPYRSRREELRLRQRRKKSVWVRSIVRGRFLVAHQRQECDSFGNGRPHDG
jgi:hypothetical protein